MANDALNGKSIEKAQDAKLQLILKAIVQLANGDYRLDLPSSVSDEPLDWIASGLNLLAESLEATVVSSDHFNAIVSSMPDSLIVLNRMGYISLANEASAKLLSIQVDQLVGLHFSRICPFLYEKKSGSVTGPEMHSTEPLELQYVGLAGKQIPVLFSASSLSHGTANGRGWVCAAQDLRARKVLEDKLRERDHALSHAGKMAALGEMAASIAHEINNPMAIIAGRADQLHDMAQDGELDPQSVLKAAERIDMTARRVSKIISGLRTFARDAESDPFVIANARKIIDDTIALCGERFKNSRIVLDINDVDPNLSAECRPVQISQVLVNLLNNAFDAVQDSTDKWIRISVLSVLRAEKLFIEIAITDSGPGIPKDIRSKIMQPFFSTKETGKGTGLGLSITNGIMVAHNGNFELDETSQHTRFVIRIPQVQPKQAAAA